MNRVGPQAEEMCNATSAESTRSKAKEVRTARVPIDSVIPGESPRLEGTNLEHVHILARIDTPLPPIIVDRSTMRVIDGMHRLHASIISGQETIEVEFFDGSERAAFVRSVEANIAHGLPLSMADRRAATERVIQFFPEWSDRRIAASTGLSDKTVASIRRGMQSDCPQVSMRIGRDGRARPVDGAVGRWIASELIGERPHASLREIAREAGISVATVRDVRDRMSRGDDPVPSVRQSAHCGRRDDEAPPGENSQPDLAGSRRGADGESEKDLDISPLLEGLKRDPSLRYSDVGRALLRWLDQRTVRLDEMDNVTARIPPHAAMIVAMMARRCSAVWENLAAELEVRSHHSSDK